MKKIATQAANYVGRLLGEVELREVLLLVGLSLLSFGLSMVWLPSAFIVPGVVLTYMAVFVGKE